MKNIIGIKLDQLPVELKWVGDLNFFDGALQSVFCDTQNIPYIYEWADSDEQYNRWIIYPTTTYLLKLYINQQLNYYDLYFNQYTSLYFCVDIDNNLNLNNIQIIQDFQIPKDYKPSNEIFFEPEESPDLEKIIAHFNLNSQIENVIANHDILEESEKKESELINLHLNSTPDKKVGFGKIRSSIFGEILSSFTELSRNVGIDLYELKDNKLGKEKLKESVDYVMDLPQAASFSIFLRPINIGNEYSIKSIVENINDIFKKCESDIIIKNDLIKKYSDSTISYYEKFIGTIKKNKLNLDVKWGNYKTQEKITWKIDYKTADAQHKRLTNRKEENLPDIKITGTFNAIDLKNNTFRFGTEEGIFYVGKFNVKLKNTQFNFITNYAVTITQKLKTTSGRKKETINYIIVSCVENILN